MGVEWLGGVASGAQGCCKWLFVIRVILTAGVVVAVRTFVAPLRVEPALPVGPFRVVVILLRPRLSSAERRKFVDYPARRRPPWLVSTPVGAPVVEGNSSPQRHRHPLPHCEQPSPHDPAHLKSLRQYYAHPFLPPVRIQYLYVFGYLGVRVGLTPVASGLCLLPFSLCLTLPSPVPLPTVVSGAVVSGTHGVAWAGASSRWWCVLSSSVSCVMSGVQGCRGRPP